MALNKRARGYQRNDAIVQRAAKVYDAMVELLVNDYNHMTGDTYDVLRQAEVTLCNMVGDARSQRDGPNSARPDLVQQRREGV